MAFLESFRKITLWLGHGVQGTESARAFARKLGEKRCHLIRFIFLIDSIESILLMRSFLFFKKYVTDRRKKHHRLSSAE